MEVRTGSFWLFFFAHLAMFPAYFPEIATGLSLGGRCADDEEAGTRLRLLFLAVPL